MIKRAAESYKSCLRRGNKMTGTEQIILVVLGVVVLLHLLQKRSNGDEPEPPEHLVIED